MASRPQTELSAWHRRGQIVPPDTREAWLKLAIWELGMGAVLFVLLSFGWLLVSTAQSRIVFVEDFSSCFASTAVLPCKGVVYRAGQMNALFSVLCGAMLLFAAAWLLWELWTATEPRPITDDFLKLLNDSFGRNWGDPRTWPWMRVLYAYGFTFLGAVLSAALVVTLWNIVAAPIVPHRATPNVETSQRFRVVR